MVEKQATEKILDLSKCLFRGWTKDEIENYCHDENEKEYYRELAEESNWIGGE